MHLISYMSEIDVPPAQAEQVIADIIFVAQKENLKHGITGVLFFADGKFLQVIEGEEQTLRDLMRNIEKDPRHKDVDYLIDTPIEARGFADWHMDSFILKKKYDFSPAILQKLVDSFENNLLPKSNTNMMFFYNALVGEAA